MTENNGDDPWYGLMSENGGALARAFAQAAAKAYGGGPARCRAA